jgi:hypothetical protein
VAGHEAIPSFPNISSWYDAQLKHTDDLTFFSLLCFLCHLFLEILDFRMKIIRNVEMVSNIQYSVANLQNFCNFMFFYV